MTRTYLDSEKLKADFLAEIGKHEQLDAVVQGAYDATMGDQFRGCAIGCSLHSLNTISGKPNRAISDHARYEEELGLPIWLAYLEDNIFERLPLELAKTWPRRFAEAIPVGAIVEDIVLAKILRWTLADAEFGVRFATDKAEIRGHIDTIVAMFDAEIAGTCTADQREVAARAAWDARAAWAARAAWDARAAWAARDAWDARAARDAWDARAARAAWAATIAAGFYPALAEYTLQLLRALPGPAGAPK